MEYRQEAIRLSRYYQQVAEDISWYGEEKERIERQKDRTEIQKKWLEEEVVIAGSFSKDARSYHASLQDAAKEELRHAPSIRRKYGYMLDMGGLKQGKVIKCREYLKLGHQEYTHISPENLYRIPAGTYLVFTLQIRNEEADFSPFWARLRKTVKRSTRCMRKNWAFSCSPTLTITTARSERT